MRKLVSTFLAGMLAFTMVAGVAAEDDPVPEVSGDATVSITSSGTLSVTITNADFDSHEYKFEEHVVTANITVNVNDGRGNNAGWSITLKADGNLTDGDKSIPLANLSLGAGAIISTAGMGIAGLTTDAFSPVTTTGQQIIGAPVNKGAGVYDVDIVGTLTIPAGQVVGNYKATLTVEAAAAPE